MGVLIVRLDNEQYVKWSTVVDAPVSWVMSRDELLRHLESEEQVPFEKAVHLIEVADSIGSSDPDVIASSLLASNRAGPNESHLTVDEIVRQYRQAD